MKRLLTNTYGLSLIELVVGLGLMGMICLGGFYFFNSTVDASDSMTMMEDFPLSFYSLSRLLTADVRAAAAITGIGQQLQLQPAPPTARRILYSRNAGRQFIRTDNAIGIPKPISDNPQITVQLNNNSFSYQNGICTLTNLTFSLVNGETVTMPTIRVNTLLPRLYVANLDPAHPQPF